MNFHLQVPPADPQAHDHAVVSSSLDESSRSWAVYKATSPSGKVYVGITCRDLGVRRIEHRYLARVRSNRHFANALGKYGRAMKWEVLADEVATLEEANRLERAFIAQFRSSDRRFGYNLTEGGDGVVANAETRAKMSASAKARGVTKRQLANLDKARGDFWVGRKHSDEAKQKMSASKAGRRISDEWRQKMSEAHQGRVFSDEHKQKIREALLRLPDSERVPKPVRRSDGAVFDSMSAAARESGLSVSQVRTALKTGRPTKRGFTFTKDTSPRSS